MNFRSFKLSDAFLTPYKTTRPDWGPLGEVTFLRTYSRKVNPGTIMERNEQWWETVQRVVEGTFDIQKEHAQRLKLPWYNDKAQKSAQKMYDKIFNFKFLPPGRGLWMMNTDFVKNNGAAALNNCGGVTTEDIATRGSFAFTWTMDALMLGVGIGFDTKGAGQITIQTPRSVGEHEFVIPDSREGWVESVGIVLDAFFRGKDLPVFNYSQIRPSGAPIRGFGGTASGPGPLLTLHEQLVQLLENKSGSKITSVEIVDIMNMIGACVVAGNVRRSAEIAIGDATDTEFLTMKDYNKHPEAVMTHRWSSNNSVFAEVGKTDYSAIAELIKQNGEPGVVWLENMQKYGRLKEGVTLADRNVKVINPCFAPETLVTTRNGVFPIEQLVSKTVDIWDGTQWVSVDNFRVTGENEEILKIELQDGSTIRATKYHTFYLEDGTQVEARNLKIADHLQISDAEDMHQADKETTHNLKPKFNRIVSIQEDGVEDKVYCCTVPTNHKFLLACGVMTGNCGEQSLESSELCCVTRNTKIQTRKGVYGIGDIIDQDVEVWNGEQWSPTKPFLAGKNKDIYRVHLSDGSYLDCTDDHKWHVKPTGKRAFRQVETKELETDSAVVPFDIQMPIEGVYEPFAYEYGLFSGDGFINDSKAMISLHGPKRKLVDSLSGGKVYKEQHPEGYSEPFVRVNLSDIISTERAKDLNDKNSGLPVWVFEMDKKSVLNFVAGIIDTDGNLAEQVNTDNFRIFGNEAKIRDLQILLRRVGINHASVSKIGSKGDITNKGKRNYDLYMLYIPSFECDGIPTVLRIAKRIGSRYKTNNAHPNGNKIDAARNQKIVKIEKLEEKQDTFCFTEPDKHMGVFGNVLTYQCLVETFPSRHDSFEEYKETIKYAYMYGKTVTLLPTHWEETNAILMKNRRIGTSQSGIIDAFVKHGRRNMIEWSDRIYGYIRALDKKYSDWLAVPQSIKVTSVKPSGSVSLLPGVSPGIHYPHDEYYIRRMRIPTDNPLIEILKKAGYEMEYVAYGQNEEERKRTTVVSFPVHEPFFTKRKDDVSIWEQMKNLVDYQTFWADNSVSITVTFKEAEADVIPSVLEAYEDQLKAVSFLPISEHGYVQAPYESITKERYDAMEAKLKKPDFTKMTGALTALGSVFCDGEHCEV